MTRFQVKDMVYVVGPGVNWSDTMTADVGYVENKAFEVMEVLSSRDSRKSYGSKYANITIYGLKLEGRDIHGKFPEDSLMLVLTNNNYDIE